MMLDTVINISFVFQCVHKTSCCKQEIQYRCGYSLIICSMLFFGSRIDDAQPKPSRIPPNLIIINASKKECDLEHVCKWTGLFVFIYNAYEHEIQIINSTSLEDNHCSVTIQQNVTLVVVMEAALGVGTTVMPMVVKNLSTKEVREW